MSTKKESEINGMGSFVRCSSCEATGIIQRDEMNPPDEDDDKFLRKVVDQIV